MTLDDEETQMFRERLADIELRLDRLDEPPDEDGLWTLYKIYLDGSPGEPFYIGITGNFRGRCTAHNNSPSSAAYAFMKQYEDQDRHCTMEAIATFTSLAAARTVERALIALLPGLVNRDIVRCRTSFGMTVAEPDNLEITPVPIGITDTDKLREVTP